VSADGDRLGRLVAEEVRRGAMPGAVWRVGDAKGAVASGCFGHAAIEPERLALTEETPFDLASLTKPLATAPLALMLERDGRLSLDATLASLFPALGSSAVGSATLRDAAAHRAGLPAWAPLYLAGATRGAYVEAIAAESRNAAPGATLYSDLGYLLLGFAVERAAGATLDRLFEERIARPLGLARCGFAGGAGAFPDAAATERRRAFEQAKANGARCDRVLTSVPRGQVHDGNAWGLGGVAGHAGLFGTAAEVAAIAVALLDPVRLGLAPGDLAPILEPSAGGDGSRTFGGLLAKDSDSVRGVLPDAAVGHWGFTGTSVWIDAARPRVYVLLTNRVHPEVPKEPFTDTRRAFHVMASSLS